jgi:hypothetical protein
MRTAGFVTAAIFLQRREYDGSIFWLTAVGHSSLKMTDHYASLTIGQLKKSHEQHSPLRAKNEAFGEGYWKE